MDNIFCGTISNFDLRMVAKEQLLSGNVSVSEAVSLCANTGNACFVDALSQQAKYKECIRWNEIREHDNSNCNFVIPAANWIGLNGSAVIKEIFSELQDMKGSLTIIGLGIHMTKENNTIDTLLDSMDKETRDILHFVSSRTERIGVRGEITAEVLDRLGITNHCMVGCPSFYEFGRTGEELRKDMSGPYVFSIRPDYSEQASKQGNIIRLAKESGSYLIFQDMRDMPRTKYEGVGITRKNMEDKFGKWIMDEEEMTSYWKEKGEIFFTLDEWKSWLNRMHISFAFGNRFHGNMMAFLSGIPALWIKHDHRMRELTDCMKLPCITYEMLDQFETAEELKEYTLSCYDQAFFINYQNALHKYIDFLERNGIRHTFASDGENDNAYM